jgi:hypothetical protein
VVKHSNGLLPCSKLVNELLAHYFLKCWKLKTPAAAIIEVNPEHVAKLASTTRQPRYFKTPCWGTLFNANSTEFLQFSKEIQRYERQKFVNPADLLRIVLFDIWLANDDRTQNNPNVLVASGIDGFEFWAIDHEAIFNGNNLKNDLYALNLYDTLLYHPALKRLLGNTLRNAKYLEELVEDAYVCIERCRVNLDAILSFIPVEWQLNSGELRQKLNVQLFSETWKKALKATFLSLVQEMNR